MHWSLQEAKNRFSEVVKRARAEGPQTVTVRGERSAVIVSAADYDAMVANRPTLVDVLLAEPAWDDEFVAEVSKRPKAPSREVDL